MTAKERLRKFVDYKGIGRNYFEKKVGISSGYVSTKSPAVGSEIIERIVRVYHDLNIEWLITGQGKMIKDLYWNEIENVGQFMYKKLVYAPLISRYAQSEYINHLNDKAYIDTLPTLPVAAEHGSKGTYICFEMWDDSMNDGSDNSYNTGDILICREINYVARQQKLFFNKPKSFVIIHEKNGIIVTQITAHDIDKEFITIHSPNPMCEDCVISLQYVKKLFNVIQLQRNIAHI
jgi:hypothetical protein